MVQLFIWLICLIIFLLYMDIKHEHYSYKNLIIWVYLIFSAYVLLHPIIFPIGETDILESSSYVLLEHNGLGGIDSLSAKQKALEYINFKYHDNESGGVVSLSVLMSYVDVKYIERDNNDGICYDRYIRYKVVYPIGSVLYALYGDIPLNGDMDKKVGFEICL